MGTCHFPDLSKDIIINKLVLSDPFSVNSLPVTSTIHFVYSYKIPTGKLAWFTPELFWRMSECIAYRLWHYKMKTATKIIKLSKTDSICNSRLVSFRMVLLIVKP